MNQEELAKIELELTEALTSFNWQVAEEVCRELICKIYDQLDVFPVGIAKSLLFKLQRKRRFNLMSMLGEAIIRSEQTHPQIHRRYAQSLIDQGIFSAAELVLQSIIQTSNSNNEKVEGYGLLGRIYKQLYVNVTSNNNPKRQAFFEKALNAYSNGYQLDRGSFWNAINIVALLKRAGKDGISLQGVPQAEQLAEEVLRILITKDEESSASSPDAWEIATYLEALIALDRNEEAEAKAFEYSLCLDADAFEINSTLRQLTEVWQLNVNELPGSKILRILRAALLQREGGVVNLKAKDVLREIESIEQIESDYEKIYGHDGFVSGKQYGEGLKRSLAIAQIETVNGTAVGTGWLARSADFFPNSGDGLVLVTNAHVISKDPSDKALLPHRARINFQELNKIYEVDKLIWTNSRDNLDTTFLTIKGKPQIEPLPINDDPVKMCEPAPRVYIIGYPSGGGLKFSIHDSRLVACSETLLHYRTPTEEGSSGSPVFDQEYWEVVALHHRGKSDMQRLDGKEGTYEANEGVSILAIKKAIESGI